MLQTWKTASRSHDQSSLSDKLGAIAMIYFLCRANMGVFVSLFLFYCWFAASTVQFLLILSKMTANHSLMLYIFKKWNQLESSLKYGTLLGARLVLQNMIGWWVLLEPFLVTDHKLHCFQIKKITTNSYVNHLI